VRIGSVTVLKARPVTLVIAAVVLVVQGLTALVLGGYVAVETVIGKPADVVSALIVAVFGVLIGAGVTWVGWNVLRGVRWSRGPAVVTQIFAIPLGWTLAPEQPLIGIPLVVVALLAAGCLLAPPSTRALMHDDHA
jgi:hypothetical protein